MLDECSQTDEACRIFCIQPRGLAAVSVAQRVAAERGESVGQTVGYHIRLESRYINNNQHRQGKKNSQHLSFINHNFFLLLLAYCKGGNLHKFSLLSLLCMYYAYNALLQANIIANSFRK